jgi:hypothetical protein
MQNSINRQLGISSVNAYKPLALLCFFVEVRIHPATDASRDPWPQLLAIFAVTCRQVFLAS